MSDIEDKRAEELSELGRALQAARRRIENTCSVCGQPFTGTSRRMYCSHKCAVRASRQAQKQSQAAPAPEI